MVLIDNEKMQLIYEDGCNYNYIAYYKRSPFFKQEAARSMIMSKKVTKFFTEREISRAKAILHAERYVAARFK